MCTCWHWRTAQRACGSSPWPRARCSDGQVVAPREPADIVHTRRQQGQLPLASEPACFRLRVCPDLSLSQRPIPHPRVPQVRKVEFGKGGVPYVVTHDGRTIRYPDPDVKVGAGQARVGHTLPTRPRLPAVPLSKGLVAWQGVAVAVRA